MKRYVARSTGGNGMTHWYEYWDGTRWHPDIFRADFYETVGDAKIWAGSGMEPRKFTVIEVELTIKEKA